MTCRLCAATLTETFVDLGLAALSPEPTADDAPQTLYPLRPLLCAACLLVQLPAYGSTAPRTPVGHARRFVDAMTGELRLGPDSLVVEVGGSGLADGFAAAGVPARSVATPAEGATPSVAADLVVAVNAYSQVPDLVGF